MKVLTCTVCYVKVGEIDTGGGRLKPNTAFLCGRCETKVKAAIIVAANRKPKSGIEDLFADIFKK